MNPQMLLQNLLIHEGIKLTAYQDQGGYWHIGIGRLIDARRGGGVTKDEALYLCRNDIARVTADLTRKLPWWVELCEARQLVLAEMCYILGWAGLAKFTRFLAACKREDYHNAADEMLQSTWAQQANARVVELAHVMRTGGIEQ